ncbi:MAG TPA: hypothetical protein VGW38_25070 [Chloroflexota bacterium]|nr:hypothetical protein [Chloroflexota bacterium]
MRGSILSRPGTPCAFLFCLLAACGPSRAELDTVCTAYDEATERLLALGDTVLANAEARV